MVVISSIPFPVAEHVVSHYRIPFPLERAAKLRANRRYGRLSTEISDWKRVRENIGIFPIIWITFTSGYSFVNVTIVAANDTTAARPSAQSIPDSYIDGRLLYCIWRRVDWFQIWIVVCWMRRDLIDGSLVFGRRRETMSSAMRFVDVSTRKLVKRCFCSECSMQSCFATLSESRFQAPTINRLVPIDHTKEFPDVDIAFLQTRLSNPFIGTVLNVIIDSHKRKQLLRSTPGLKRIRQSSL